MTKAYRNPLAAGVAAVGFELHDENGFVDRVTCQCRGTGTEDLLQQGECDIILVPGLDRDECTPIDGKDLQQLHADAADAVFGIPEKRTGIKKPRHVDAADRKRCGVMIDAEEMLHEHLRELGTAGLGGRNDLDAASCRIIGERYFTRGTVDQQIKIVVPEHQRAVRHALAVDGDMNQLADGTVVGDPLTFENLGLADAALREKGLNVLLESVQGSNIAPDDPPGGGMESVPRPHTPGVLEETDVSRLLELSGVPGVEPQSSRIVRFHRRKLHASGWIDNRHDGCLSDFGRQTVDAFGVEIQAIAGDLIEPVGNSKNLFQNEVLRGRPLDRAQKLGAAAGKIGLQVIGRCVTNEFGYGGHRRSLLSAESVDPLKSVE